MGMGIGVQRTLAVGGLAVSGFLAMPVAATFLDHPPGRENWIIPAAAGGMAAVGAGIAALNPAIVPGMSRRLPAMAAGAGIGVAAGIAGFVALQVLLGN